MNTVGSLRCKRRRRQRERQKSNRLNRQNSKSARASHFISLPSLHDYDGTEMPNFTIYGGRKQATAKFSYGHFLWIQLQKSLLAFDNELE